METDKPRVLLIGCGFIGTALLNQLLRSEYRVRVISRHPPLLDSKSAELHRMEINEALQHDGIWQEVDFVIYTAHHDRPGDREYNVQTDGDLKLINQVLNKLKGSACKKFVYLSSGGAVYGLPQTKLVDESHLRAPISAYGESKKRIEDLLLENSKTADFSTLILRPSNVYGDQEPDRITGIVNHLILCSKLQRNFTIWGDGNGLKGYLHVNDLNALILLTLQDHETRVGVFNVCSEEYYTPRQLLKMISDLGYSLQCNFEDQKKFDVCQIQLSSKKVQKAFNWRPNQVLKDYITTHLNHV
ncbi:MAG: NAD-dependent epimerase [Fluviicola sp.]|jgi:UDP-glucose 4-epimerase|uniref:NAD-dependent epimerase/dehydratase family protein n=1 Tax=Fluviicola sp. TaxID=1917219 RepID=UPI00263768FF|nr:NAD-dependent epimerase/dehydratase family protein [Fluviicola sp.]MDF3027775.1 NAD-dependent epimerase [Fluviicola sp.]